MLELWGMWSTPLLPSLPGPLWPGVVALSMTQIEVFVLSMSQIEVFDILTDYQLRLMLNELLEIELFDP